MKIEKSVFTLVFTSIMGALIIIMTLTGVGYIPVGPFRLTLNTLPVAIGAMICGPVAGCILGAIFGLTSFSLAVFGIDAVGTLLLSFGWKQAICLLITCVVPRVLCGLIPGLIGKYALNHNRAKKTLLETLGCASTAIVNTILFVGLFWIFFANELMNSSKMIELFGGAVNSFGLLFVIFAGWNAVFEVLVNIIIGTAIVKAIKKQHI